MLDQKRLAAAVQAGDKDRIEAEHRELVRWLDRAAAPLDPPDAERGGRGREPGQAQQVAAEDVGWLADQLHEPVTVLGTVVDEPTFTLPGLAPLALDTLINAFNGVQA